MDLSHILCDAEETHRSDLLQPIIFGLEPRTRDPLNSREVRSNVINATSSTNIADEDVNNDHLAATKRQNAFKIYSLTWLSVHTIAFLLSASQLGVRSCHTTACTFDDMQDLALSLEAMSEATRANIACFIL